VNPYLVFSWQFHGTFPILSDVLFEVKYEILIIWSPLFEACLLGVTVRFGLIFGEFMKHFLIKLDVAFIRSHMLRNVYQVLL
jgi:hypothetical protein